MNQSSTEPTRRHPLGLKRTYLKMPAYVTAISLALISGSSTSSAEVAASALSKRFLRLNEYLFNGVETTTVIAASVSHSQNETPT